VPPRRALPTPAVRTTATRHPAACWRPGASLGPGRGRGARLARDQVAGVDEFLGQRQHQRAERGDVDAQGLAGCLHEVAPDPHAQLADLVVLLHHAAAARARPRSAPPAPAHCCSDAPGNACGGVTATLTVAVTGRTAPPPGAPHLLHRAARTSRRVGRMRIGCAAIPCVPNAQARRAGPQRRAEARGVGAGAGRACKPGRMRAGACTRCAAETLVPRRGGARGRPAEARGAGCGRGGARAALVRLVGGAQVRAHEVLQAVLGAPRVGPPVGQQRGDAAQAEDAAGDEHGALVAPVQVVQDVLRAGHQHAHARVALRERGRAVSRPPPFLSPLSFSPPPSPLGHCAVVQNVLRTHYQHAHAGVAQRTRALRWAAGGDPSAPALKAQARSATKRADPWHCPANICRALAGPCTAAYGLGLELQCDAAIASRNLPQPWSTLSSSLARSSAMTLALQPMPPSEYVLTSCRSPKRFTTNALSEGVGLNVQHVVMTASTELASMPWRRPGHGSVAAWHGQRRRLAPHRHGCLPCVHSRTRARGRPRSTPWSRGATARRMLAQQQLAACRKDPEHQFCPAQPAGPAHGRGRCAGGAPSAPTASGCW